MQEYIPPLAGPSSVSARCFSPVAYTSDGQPHFSTRMASASSLRRPDRDESSPLARRPPLSRMGSTTSRNSSLPTSPLDNIPEKLWPRVLRTSSTPETSNPDLSIDEITSTRLSLDDEAILTSLPEEDNRKTRDAGRPIARKGFGGIWGDNSDRLKKMSQRLKNFPGGLFVRRDRGLRGSSSGSINYHYQPATFESKLPAPDFMGGLGVTELLPPADDGEFDEPKMKMDYECKPKETDSCSEEISKISCLIRKDLHEVTSRERTLLPAPGYPERIPRHFVTPPTYVYAASSSTVNSFHTAEDRLLHGPRTLKAFPRQMMARTSSIGSVEEMRSHAFGSRRLGRPSLSGASVRHSSAPSIGRSSRPTSRPGTNAGSVSSSTLAPRRPIVYMDAPNGCSDTIWSGVNFITYPSTSSTARPQSKSISILNSQEEGLDLSLELAPEVEMGMGDRPGYTKIPLYVPRRIERKQTCPKPDQMRPILTPVPATPSVGREQADQPAIHTELTSSNPAISDISFTSLQGQTSIHSHTEREQMLQEVECQSSVRPSTGSRERLSRALTNAWAERTLRKKQKGCKRDAL
ncbi:hypothetical protein A1O3_01195 [Capronia epimyces CBS 606.96]|uniref:Uncharacterized protein n=1 Tax=Capronia epimyces CBS 606.96 TaxID=1182542 RepID=W9YJB6_9EURO|nr:uncharacterized protein A1O3_01195 [Capronia epimyces CBS 606.96]EXJ92643.1 hypothetical protein A1O3_01195 [Capronia epimyces CBS 606.96]